MIYWLATHATWLAGRLLFRLRVEGRENVPRSGALLIVSNHLSHLDPPLVAAVLPRTVFYMAKQELFKVPFLRAVLRSVRTILVQRGQARQSIEAALSYLRQGQPVVIFPEGTRSESGRLGRGLGGAVSLALRSACQVLPVAIIGSGQALHKGSHRLHRTPVQVKIGQPFSLPLSRPSDRPSTLDPAQPPRELLRAATAELMARIEALLPESMHATAEEKAGWYGG